MRKTLQAGKDFLWRRYHLFYQHNRVYHCQIWCENLNFFFLLFCSQVIRSLLSVYGLIGTFFSQESQDVAEQEPVETVKLDSASRLAESPLTLEPVPLSDDRQNNADAQEMTSDPPEARVGAQEAGYDFSAPFSPLAALQSCSGIHQQSSDALWQSGSDEAAPRPSPVVRGRVSHSHIDTRERASDLDAPSVLYSAGDGHIKVGENVSEVVAPLPRANVHGHASDAHIKVGENVWDVATPLPSASIYGHSSDSRIKVGENVSDVDAPLPSPSIFGHSSDANIKVGEYVSNTPKERPRWSKHGHASDCTLQTGCVVSGPETTLSPLPGSSYGHSSDSALGGGCVVSGDEPERRPLPGSLYGHSSDSTLTAGCLVSKPEPLPSPLPGSSYGHSSDSSLGVSCVVLGQEPQASAQPRSAYGHSSDSSLGVGCVVKGRSGEDQQQTEDNRDGNNNE